MQTNPLKLLSRLFRSNPDNYVVSELYSKMAQPLFVHPQLGEQVMRSYLEALKTPMMGDETSDTSGVTVTIHEGVAVMEISGGLVARQTAVPCQQSPASYEGIKSEMQALFDNQEIHTIVGRFDTPGGMAAQNMDLSDFIYASRGQGTRLIAMVDDMAYSAGYGIASAFDEIWLTRTGGVGSVGVVSYHVDQSEANAKAGIKVEYIYAGDKKVLGNPHEALSDEARAQHQQEVTRLYTLFTATVARNLGMSVADVQATQAGTFHGEEALEVGFAHKIGTFDDLLQSIFDKRPSSATIAPTMQVSEETIVTDEELEESAKLETEAAIDKAKLEVEAKMEEEVLAAAAELEESTKLAEQAKAKEVAAEIEATKRHAAIRAMCTAAGAQASADDFIKADMETNQVRELLLELTSTSESNIANSTSVALNNNQDNIKMSWKAAFKKAEKGSY